MVEQSSLPRLIAEIPLPSQLQAVRDSSDRPCGRRRFPLDTEIVEYYQNISPLKRRVRGRKKGWALAEVTIVTETPEAPIVVFYQGSYGRVRVNCMIFTGPREVQEGQKEKPYGKEDFLPEVFSLAGGRIVVRLIKQPEPKAPKPRLEEGFEVGSGPDPQAKPPWWQD